MPAVWADQPFPLISTESFDKKVRYINHPSEYTLTSLPQLSHGAYYAATQMAGAHNGVIRGLNALYLQAPALPPGDTSTAADFLTYCQCWCEGLQHHHDAEEETYFPRLERVASQPGLMDHNVEQHAAFGVGFTAFHDYVNTCDPKDYDAATVKRLIDAFAEPLTTHLHDEIDSLRELDKYESMEMRKAYDELDSILRGGDAVCSTLSLSVETLARD